MAPRATSSFSSPSSFYSPPRHVRKGSSSSCSSVSSVSSTSSWSSSSSCSFSSSSSLRRTRKGSRKPFGFSDWKEGDIAFLKPWEEITNELRPDAFRTFREAIGYQERACGHPVIILKASPDGSQFAVTTVSAYSSSSENGYLAPWNQSCHDGKQRKHFRSFQGSERANSRAALLLEDSKLMPKPALSWVYTQAVFVVGVDTLKVFTKSRDHLRLTQESLTDLWGQMAVETRDFERIVQRVAGPTRVPPTIARPQKGSQRPSASSNGDFSPSTIPLSAPADKPPNSLKSWAQVARD